RPRHSAGTESRTGPSPASSLYAAISTTTGGNINAGSTLASAASSTAAGKAAGSRRNATAPNAPASGSSTNPGNWYLHENTTMSPTNGTSTPTIRNSNAARLRNAPTTANSSANASTGPGMWPTLSWYPRRTFATPGRTAGSPLPYRCDSCPIESSVTRSGNVGNDVWNRHRSTGGSVTDTSSRAQANTLSPSP